MSVFAPSNITSLSPFHSIFPIGWFVCLSLFSNLLLFKTSIVCLEDPKIKSILPHPSTHSAGAIVVSIPAVIPMLYLPTFWNSFGTVICAQISGWLGSCGELSRSGSINCHSGLSLINPNGVFPHLCGKTFTSYLPNSTTALTMSLLLAPYPE